MDYQERNEQTGPYRSFRTSLDLAMGVLYIVIGVAVISVRFFGSVAFSSGYAAVLGGLLVLYGLFRVYRGFKVVFARRKEKTKVY